MKKVFFSIAFLCLFASSSAFAGPGHNHGQDRGGQKYQNIRSVRDLDTNGNGQYDPGEVDPSCAYRCGPCVCYCPVTRFKPQYYTTCRCEQEEYKSYKRCCRQVPQYYERTHCRYKPEYYKTTHCRYVPQYYYVCETKCKPKYCYDKHCKYVPYTCWEKNCVDLDCDSGGCGSGGCASGGCAPR